MALVEEEMELTLESYKSVLEAGVDGGSEADSFLDLTGAKLSVIKHTPNQKANGGVNGELKQLTA